MDRVLSEKNIVHEIVGKVAVLTLNSERTLNALSLPMIKNCRQLLNDWKNDEKIACVFMQGSGSKAFCAGGDVRRLQESISMQEQESISKGNEAALNKHCLDFFINEYRLDYEVHQYDKPIVVWSDGIVMGGGIGMTNGASHKIVTERSVFAMPEILIGLYPDVGATWFLNKLHSAWGLYLGLTATRLNAADCLHLKLADFFLPASAKSGLLESLCKASWTGSPSDNRQLASKTILSLSEHIPNKPELEISPLQVKAHEAFISKFESVSSVHEFKKILFEHRKQSDWIEEGARNFEAGSPVSAGVSFEQLHRGRALSLEEVFKSELNLSMQCTRYPDFAEGVRALLVDKDNKPKWQPAHLEDLNPDLLSSFFEALWREDENPLAELGS